MATCSSPHPRPTQYVPNSTAVRDCDRCREGRGRWLHAFVLSRIKLARRLESCKWSGVWDERRRRA